MKKPILAAMLSCSGTELTDDEKRIFSEFNPLGITLFNRNIANPHQIKKLVAEIKETIGRRNVLIAIDQEGGRVRRLREPDFRGYMAQRQLGEIAEEQDIETAKKIAADHAWLIADDLHSLGINWNYAPVIDLCRPQTSKVLASRCFSGSPQINISLARTMLEVYRNSAICPCIKHLPALGPAENDPHLELPIISKPIKDLEKDFSVAQALANESPAAMTAHILLPEIDNRLPATQSPRIIAEIIRGLIGFNGFLISDAIDMHALNGSLGLKAQLSLDAGCDAVCYCGGTLQGLTEVCKNCRSLSDVSCTRLEKIQNLITAPHKTVDIPQIYKDYLHFSANLKNYDEDYDATEVLHRMTSNQ